MAFYAVNYLYRADADVAAVRPKHRAYLATLIESGILKASGPIVGEDRDRALLIFEAESADEVQEALNKDPMRTEHVLEESQIHEWNPVLGVFQK